MTEVQQERNRKYKELRHDYLEKHPVCEVCHRKIATQIHHKARRKGFNLFRFFLGVCQTCHSWIHDNSTAAKELGYIIEYDPKEENIFEKQ
jgi:hypothetical protein